jgi:hypothetical protein
LRRCRSTLAFLLVSSLVTGSCERAAPTTATVAESEHVVVGALAGRTRAALTVADAASRIRIVTATLPGLLYRISTPAGSGLAPSASERAGRVTARLRPVAGDGPDEVLIVLNRTVGWDVRTSAGAGEQALDLSGARLSRVEAGTSGLVELRLPVPDGPLPITLEGAGTVSMAVPAGVPMRLRLIGGAGSAVTPWTAGGGPVPPRTVLQPPDWRTARDRFTVLARSEVGVLTLHRLRPAAR